jgi:pyruvate dehydrogenase E2 component (dihydrolipoamide acetyltransferase)
MAQLLRMPAVAANADMAVLLSWSVDENTSYTADDTLAEVETDKAVVDIDAESDGILLKRLVTAGAQVEVGAPIALLGSAGDSAKDINTLLKELGVDVAPEDSAPTPDEPAEYAEATVGETLTTDIGGNADEVVEPTVAGSPTADNTTSPGASSPSTAQRIFASPIARRMAHDAQVAVETLIGTGPGGRIRRSDVEAAITARGAEASVPHPAPLAKAAALPATNTAVHRPSPQAQSVGDWVDEPHSRLRAVIASRLTESKNTIPHFYLRASIRVDKMLALRAELNAVQPIKISVNDLVVAAAARAHAVLPDMNCIWTDSALRRFASVDVSIAVASERGLVTPTLRSVETLSVTAISTQTKAMVAKADAGRLKAEDLEGGSLTISNLGMFGVEDFAAIINPPQSAILAVGAAKKEPVIGEDGQLEVGTVLRVTLSVDHRAVDGAIAAQWLKAFTALLENPMRILL